MILFFVGCQQYGGDSSFVGQNQDLKNQQDDISKKPDLSRLVGVWQSQVLTVDPASRIWDKTTSIRLVVHKLSDEEAEYRPVPYEYRHYDVDMFERIEGDSRWLVVPDTEDGWIDSSDPDTPIVFRLGGGSHIPLQISSIEDGVMKIRGPGLTSELRLVPE
ncbi:MAG: hypothetical protein AAGI37_08315 [Planctomycetota bacterium]